MSPMVIPLAVGAIGAISAASSASGDEGGDSDRKYKANDPYQIDRNAAVNGYDLGHKADIMAEQRQTKERVAPTMNAAQLGAASQATNIKIAANERTANQNIGPVQNANTATLGQSATMTGAGIQRQDNEGRMGQSKLIGNLEETAAGRGPSQAGLVLADAQDRAAKQGMSMAASMKGGQSAALQQRNVMASVAQGNQQAARDAAMLKVQEQQNAVNSLGQNLTAMRGSDIGVNTAQANLNQDAAGNNMNAANQFALQNAANSQQTNLFNAQNVNQRQLDQSQMNQQNAQFNATNTNTLNSTEAGMRQQTNLTNLAAINGFRSQQATMDQSANQNNLSAALQNQAQKDAHGEYLLSTDISLDQAETNRKMTMEQMYANQSMGVAVQDQKAYEAAQDSKQARENAWIGFGSNVVGSLGSQAASDENMKKNVTDIEKPTLEGGTGDLSTKKKTGPNLKLGEFGTQIRHKDETSPDWNILAGNAVDPYTPAPRRASAKPATYGVSDADTLETSDEREKKNVSFYTEQDTRDLLDNIHAHKYEYKNPDAYGAGEGEFISPMAQELEKSKLGKNMVETGPDGKKMVQYGKGFGFLMASMASLNERTNKLEKKKG